MRQIRTPRRNRLRFHWPVLSSIAGVVPVMYVDADVPMRMVDGERVRNS